CVPADLWLWGLGAELWRDHLHRRVGRDGVLAQPGGPWCDQGPVLGNMRSLVVLSVLMLASVSEAHRIFARSECLERCGKVAVDDIIANKGMPDRSAARSSTSSG